MIILWWFPSDFVNSLPGILSNSNFNPQRNTQQHTVNCDFRHQRIRKIKKIYIVFHSIVLIRLILTDIQQGPTHPEPKKRELKAWPWKYSRLPLTQSLYNSNLLLTRSNFHFPSNNFLYDFTLNKSTIFQLPLKFRIIGSRLNTHRTYEFQFVLKIRCLQGHSLRDTQWEYSLSYLNMALLNVF